LSLRNLLSVAKFFLITINSIQLVFPQSFERELNLIPVFDGEGLLSNTFSGGHNNPEHQFVDIDGDDDLDMFYLESDQTFGWYKNIGDKFNAEFELQLNNPAGLFFSNWFCFVDIDEDSDLDYLTGNVDQISLYRNDGSVNSPIFTLQQNILVDDMGDPIYTEFDSNHMLADIDADNDFDLIMGSTAGSLVFYENIGTAQQYNFKFITNVWQNIIIIGGDLPNLRHGASSIEFADIDADNDLDLFWGDFFSKSLYFIENQGTATDPDMQLVSNVYPINSDSVYTSGFNMPRFVDIDSDDDLDLFVSVLYNSTVPQTLMFYENMGNRFAASHQLITPNYLKTLDVRNNSIPTFVDIDDDNDLDLFLGSLISPLGKIHFLENTGTSRDPAFLYFDSSFFNIEKDLSTSPVFCDLDGDKDYDLLVGRFDGKIDLYLNSGTPSSPLFKVGETLRDENGEIIDAGNSSVPFFVDIDGDLDFDLAVGSFGGKFDFYLNNGSAQNYSFQIDSFYFTINDTILLDVGDNSTPVLFDYDKDGSLDLFSGSRNGKLYYFKNEGNNLSPVWTEITDLLINENFGGNTAPYLVDIDNDTDTDLFLGNVKGGLYLYENTELSIVAEWEIKPVDEFTLNAYPNPFNPTVNILLNTRIGDAITIDIYNILGEKVKNLYNGFISAGVKTFQWNGRNESGLILPSGTYLVLARSENQNQVIKISFLK
jgi:hypothetical protein